MKNFIKFAALALPLLLAACGDPVTIQTGEVGKQLSSSGLEVEVREPGTIRLDGCWFSACPRIVRLQVNRTGADIKIDSVYLPKSNVDVTNITVGVQYRVRQDKQSINRVFAEVRPVASKDEARAMLISADMVWDTFGKRVVPAIIVDAFKDLEVDAAMNVGTELSGYVKTQVDKALMGTPIEITQLDISNTDVPDMVINAKRALFAIQDNQTRQIRELESGIAVESRRQTFQQLRARNDGDIAKQLGIPVAQYMCLKIAERLADAADEKGMTVVANADCGLSDRGTAPILPLNTGKIGG